MYYSDYFITETFNKSIFKVQYWTTKSHVLQIALKQIKCSLWGYGSFCCFEMLFVPQSNLYFCCSVKAILLLLLSQIYTFVAQSNLYFCCCSVKSILLLLLVRSFK